MGLELLNEWINLANFWHAKTYSRKLKVISVVIGWAWSNMDVAFRSWDSKICFISKIN